VSPSRREFLQTLAAAGVGLYAAPALAAPQAGRARLLHNRFPDLRRHFIFEYYPWYETGPYRHWDQAKRHPPIDIASNYMPRLGAYNSADASVIEQHARWIADIGVGAINVSWWGPGDVTDRTIPVLMDVMAAHDIHVTFHLEPYTDSHASNYARDIQYLLKEYGDRRHWDCFLLLEHADGTVGPVFKSFRTIVPETGTDCHGNRYTVGDYAADGTWRRQTDRVRETFRDDFDRITLLADSLNIDRTRAGGFDGIAIYDNFVPPADYAGYSAGASRAGLVFSFNVNPGYDGIDPRRVDPDSCFEPSAFLPSAEGLDWASAADRERAASLSRDRIAESLQATLAVQTDPALANDQRGFFLVYINSFNEWHEGDSFEPMMDAGAIPSRQRFLGYHNPTRGDYRLTALRDLLRAALPDEDSSLAARRA
jgi:glycosyl hydrolase family 99